MDNQLDYKDLFYNDSHYTYLLENDVFDTDSFLSLFNEISPVKPVENKKPLKKDETITYDPESYLSLFNEKSPVKPVEKKKPVTKKKLVEKKKPLNKQIESDIFFTESVLVYEQIKSYDEVRRYMLHTLNKNKICIQFSVRKTKYCVVYIKYVAGENVYLTDLKYVRFSDTNSSINVSFKTPDEVGAFKVFLVIESENLKEELPLKSISKENNKCKLMDEIMVFSHRSMIKNDESLRLTMLSKIKRKLEHEEAFVKKQKLN